MGERLFGAQDRSVEQTVDEMYREIQATSADSAREEKTVPQRLEWIAVILFVVNYFVMVYLYSAFYREEAWGLFTVAVSVATAVLLLMSVLFSIFGKRVLSKYAIGLGIIGLMISVVSVGVKLMQTISEYSGYWRIL